MIAEIGLPEIMATFVYVVLLILGSCLVAWLVYCISSIVRMADALERIADALEGEDAEEEEGEK